MGKYCTYFLILLLSFACEQENHSPNAFLNYESPFYENINGNLLLDLDNEIKSGLFGDIHSLLILRDDNIVFENYYSNYQRSDLHPIGASTQSVVSALVGVALAEDSALSIGAKIIDQLPKYSGYFENIPQKDQIEIRHLMSNSSGLWWDEWTYPFGSEKNDAYKMSLSEDWISAVLSTPMIREPGYEFNYNSGNGILMAPILEDLTGMEVEKFAQEKLFNPLEIVDWKWERISGDFVNSSWGLHLKPIDMAKIGYLFLKNGVWNEQNLFDDNWSFRSSRRRKDVSNAFSYGYFWWRFTNNVDVVFTLKQNDVYFSWGDGGQFIFIVPHLNVVVVTTAGNYSNNDIMAINMLRDYIFPSILDRLL